MALLTRNAILSADDLPTKDVPVPEWGGTVRVRSLMARDRDAIDAALHDARKDNSDEPLNLRAMYAAAGIVDEKGVQLFSLDDVEALGAKSGAALDRVYSAITELNRIGPGEVDKAAGE
ncbi:hypothetical protein BSL82_05670 [Tardibacter chloracetimidivorans]|uniref:Phage tail protein n=1 Tax=Tardibacter chloracetimidivorans TaxID=1921510 RepID=A0A1L3ZT98_9SPHN|nr:hypothetical protein [Tardibacter chloracetimidivorans]API58861.1 hypothetical protein BSL82_05670 [Tardibacter chloracetimidivorans]